MSRQPSSQPRHAPVDWTPPRARLWRRSAIAVAASAAVALGGVAGTQPASAVQPSVFMDAVETWGGPSAAEIDAAEAAAERRAVEKAVEAMAAAEEARAERAAAAKAAKEEAAAEKAAQEKAAAEAAAAARSALPLDRDTYELGAGFGATGSWSRYHTGMDFSAGVGTPVHAVVPGTVVATTAGSWAGVHVAIEAEDGSSTLYAHLSARNVQIGDTVEAGDLIGRVGNTGRSFGAHLHLEHYPAGVTPGDVYSATDPHAYLEDLGIRV